MARKRAKLAAVVLAGEGAHTSGHPQGDVHDALGTPRRPSVGQARQLHGQKPCRLSQITGILWQSLRIPAFDRISREDGLTAGRIRSALADANPSIPAHAIGVKLNSRGWLEEVRLCYAKAFRPARCTPARFGAKDGTPAKIWRGL